MTGGWKEAYAAMHRDGAAAFPAAGLRYVLEVARGEAKRREAPLSPTDLTASFRRSARDDFGPLLAAVLKDWSLATPSDLGRAVLLLGRYGCLTLDPEDSYEAFAADSRPLAEGSA